MKSVAAIRYIYLSKPVGILDGHWGQIRVYRLHRANIVLSRNTTEVNFRFLQRFHSKTFCSRSTEDLQVTLTSTQ